MIIFLSTTVSGSAASLEPLRVCFDGFELFRTICEDMVERLKNLLRKLNRKTIGIHSLPIHPPPNSHPFFFPNAGEYSMKETYTRKLNQLEASLGELKNEGDQAAKRIRPMGANFVTNVGRQQIFGAVTNTILQNSEGKKKEVQL